MRGEEREQCEVKRGRRQYDQTARSPHLAMACNVSTVSGDDDQRVKLQQQWQLY